MKRTLFAFVAVLALTTSGLAAAQSEQPTPDASNQTGTMDQQPSTTSDQPASTPTDPATTSSTLPSTATPLPLMGLGGLVSLAAGTLLARSRRKS